MKDFTLKTYRELLLALRQEGYSFYTFEDWCNEKAQSHFVILRHDVDLKAARSLAIAQIESEMGIRATYYFRVVPQSNQPDIIRVIAGLNHEIGYHYEDLSLFKGNAEKSIKHFERQLAYFRHFYPVRTICMHGSPTSKWDNRDIWKKYNYSDYGIIGEPYFDFLSLLFLKERVEGEIYYFTDTARMWDGDKFNVRDKINSEFFINKKKLIISTNQQINKSTNQLSKIHSTFDLINWLKTGTNEKGMMITTHPQRWTDNFIEWIQELIMQNIKNYIKQLIIHTR
jgi:hypothetical protein